jgi:hypothetical protein
MIKSPRSRLLARSVPNHDAAWTDYKRDAKELRANRNAGFFRSIFVPSLAPAITSSGEKQVFADALDQKLTFALLYACSGG